MGDKLQLDPRYLYQVARDRLDELHTDDDGLVQPLGQVVASLRSMIDIGETIVEVTRDGWETCAREVAAQAEWSDRYASLAWGAIRPRTDARSAEDSGERG